MGSIPPAAIMTSYPSDWAYSAVSKAVDRHSCGTMALTSAGVCSDLCNPTYLGGRCMKIPPCGGWDG